MLYMDFFTAPSSPHMNWYYCMLDHHVVWSPCKLAEFVTGWNLTFGEIFLPLLKFNRNKSLLVGWVPSEIFERKRGNLLLLRLLYNVQGPLLHVFRWNIGRYFLDFSWLFSSMLSNFVQLLNPTSYCGCLWRAGCLPEFRNPPFRCSYLRTIVCLYIAQVIFARERPPKADLMFPHSSTQLPFLRKLSQGSPFGCTCVFLPHNFSK